MVNPKLLVVLKATYYISLSAVFVLVGYVNRGLLYLSGVRGATHFENPNKKPGLIAGRSDIGDDILRDRGDRAQVHSDAAGDLERQPRAGAPRVGNAHRIDRLGRPALFSLEDAGTLAHRPQS